MKSLAIFAALVCSTGILAAEDRPLELRVDPRTCLDPCTIRVSIRTERHALNRALVLELDSYAYARGSVITLDGDNAALIHERSFESLPPGAYEVRVKLVRSSNRSIERREHVRVAGTDDLE